MRIGVSIDTTRSLTADRTNHLDSSSQLGQHSKLRWRRRSPSAETFSHDQDHYQTIGYCEGRLPAEPELDAGRYLERYSDIAAAHSNGVLPDLAAHFVHYGYREGRSSSRI